MNATEAHKTATESVQKAQSERWNRIYNAIDGACRKGEYACALSDMTLVAEEVRDLEELGYEVILNYIIKWEKPQ